MAAILSFSLFNEHLHLVSFLIQVDPVIYVLDPRRQSEDHPMHTLLEDKFLSLYVQFYFGALLHFDVLVLHEVLVQVSVGILVAIAQDHIGPVVDVILVRHVLEDVSDDRRSVQNAHSHAAFQCPY